ncbi:MAG: adenylate kinase [Muribaculaceae bacterium]|nr:adenylate kinase [Muribaculaceae bacterium]
MNIVIFGAPGSGKGTQSEKMIQEYGLHHISTGELLRDHIARGTHLGKVADTYISQGLLIPDELIVELLSEIFKEHPEKAAKGVIFDGFPRTIAQAEALSKMLGEYGTVIHAVIGLEVNEDELVRRMLERGKQSGRSDDNIDTIRKRLDVYHKQTAPLKDYYLTAGSYHSINGNRSVDEIFEDIRKSLDPYKEK